MLNDSPRPQIAALPLRKRSGRIEILLISSRETKRWIIPKGWPMLGLEDFRAAEQEAFEEAGVRGKMGEEPIGSFSYDKRKKSGLMLPCSVTVFALSVEKLHRDWPERRERKRKWFSASKAIDLVTDEGLKAVIEASLT